MNRAIVSLLALLALCLSGAAASASVIAEITTQEAARQANLIFVGKVVSKQGQWEEGRRRIWTLYRVEVEQWIAGERRPKTLTLRFLGGVVNGVGMRVSDMPELRVGERVLLLCKDQPGLYCPVVGWWQGKFAVVKDDAGRDIVGDHQGRPLTAVSGGRALRGAGRSRVTLSQFVSQVRQWRNSRTDVRDR